MTDPWPYDFDPREPIDSEIAQLRERLAIAHDALREYERERETRERKYATVMRAIDHVISSPLFTHRYCIVPGKNRMDGCTCDYERIVSKLEIALTTFKYEREIEKTEMERLKKLFGELK